MFQSEINLKDLYQKYIVEKISCNLIAKEYHCSIVTVIRCIQKQGWPMRSNSEALSLRRRCNHSEVVQLYQQGKSTSDIAEQLSMAQVTIAGILKKVGYQLKKDNSVYDQQIYKEYFDNKLSLSKVAKLLDLAPASVQERFKINNWTMRSHVEGGLSKRKCNYDDLVREYKEGKSAPYLSYKYSISSQQIYYILSKHGIKSRSPFATTTSAEERSFKDLLIQLNIPFDYQVHINRLDGKRDWSFDFKVNNWLIEINGEYYHNNYYVQDKDKRKRQDAIDQGYNVATLKGNSLRYREMLREQLWLLTNNSVLDDYEVAPANAVTIAPLLRGFHYLGSVPRNIKYAFVLKRKNGDHVGACTFSVPLAFTHRDKIELSRLVLLYNLPPNTASWFIAQCLKSINMDVITYADPDMGHTGGIYKALNFKYIGKSSSTYCYIDIDGKYYYGRAIHDRAKLAGLPIKEFIKQNGYIRIRKQPKLIYVYQKK